jgi:hypothetical protein
VKIFKSAWFYLIVIAVGAPAAVFLKGQGYTDAAATVEKQVQASEQSYLQAVSDTKAQ